MMGDLSWLGAFTLAIMILDCAMVLARSKPLEISYNKKFRAVWLVLWLPRAYFVLSAWRLISEGRLVG